MRLPMQRRPSDTEPVHGDHAVVLGASMAGLLAARVLAEFYDQVTVVERDDLTDRGQSRRGVPQGRHAHILLPRGARALEELLPGVLRELVEQGAPTLQRLHQIHFEMNGHPFYQDTEPGHVVAGRGEGALFQPSRPLLEAVVRGRVRSLPNVEVLDGYDVDGVTADATRSRVTGARVTPRRDGSPARELAADLVVSATGRSGRAAVWLEQLGYPAPPEERLDVDLRYVTQRLRLAPQEYDVKRAVVVGPTSDRPQGAACFAQENGTWVVTLIGYAGHHPPTDRQGWLRLAETVLPEGPAAALLQAEPLGGLVQHRFPANLRRRYDKLDRFPEGLLVTGDALSSFNPVYGQGMTVAALEAQALRASLAQGDGRLAQRFFRTAAKPISDAWRFAVGGDLAMPPAVVPGPRPLPGRAANAYIEKFQAVAEDDPVMAWRFLDVTGFEQPMSALFSGDSLRRMTSSGRRTPPPTASASALR